MTAKFKARDSFAIEGIGFVIGGTILEGNITKGMSARLRFNSSLSVDLPITAVEFIRRTGGGEDIGLVFKGTEDEIDLWKSLNIGGEEIDIVQNESEAPTIGGTIRR